MKTIYLDIETLPADVASHATLRILFDKQKAKKAKKSKEESEPKEGDAGFDRYVLETSFDGSFGRILCIGYAINNDSARCLQHTDEKKILQDFWKIAADCDLFVGHNVMDFDLRFIYQRSIVLGVKPTKDLSFARYRSFPIFDTMKEWGRWAFGGSVGLEHIALALGIPSPKDGIDGSQVYQYFKEGRIKEICDYCIRDVETTRSVYKKMIFEDIDNIEKSVMPF